MSSHDGSRSVRQSKRYSVTALYLSMSAKDKELEIEDDLARGRLRVNCPPYPNILTMFSPEDTARAQGQDFVPVQEELRPREGRPIPRLAYSLAHPESHGIGRGMIYKRGRYTAPELTIL